MYALMGPHNSQCNSVQISTHLFHSKEHCFDVAYNYNYYHSSESLKFVYQIVVVKWTGNTCKCLCNKLVLCNNNDVPI